MWLERTAPFKRVRNAGRPEKMFWEIIGRLFGVYVIGRAFCVAWSFLKSFAFPMLGWRLNLRSYGEWAGKIMTWGP